MLDRDGYRPNVAIVVANSKDRVFWGKRIREHSWQFPQGGINVGEAPEEAMYRELKEEVGLDPAHVKILGRTRDWLRYEVPQHWIKREWRGSYRGQKQIWYLLRLTGRDSDVSLRATDHPEFDAWRWHDYWIPLENVIDFKREVYRRGLTELERYLHHRPQTRRERPCTDGHTPWSRLPIAIPKRSTAAGRRFPASFRAKPGCRGGSVRARRRSQASIRFRKMACREYAAFPTRCS